MERCAAVQVKEPEMFRGKWLAENPGFQNLFVELGCGKGRFTCETAKELPDTLLVAIERVPDAMVIGMERTVAEDLQNVRFIDSDVISLPAIFESGEASRIYINFCDPWPSKKHAKRRLTSPGFLKLYRDLLAPGGEIHFKTDNLPLFEYSLEQFEENGFALYEVTRDLHENGPCGVMTDYETKFYEQGIQINRCVARLK